MADTAAGESAVKLVGSGVMSTVTMTEPVTKLVIL